MNTFVDNRKTKSPDLVPKNVILLKDQLTILMRVEDDTRQFVNMLTGKFFPYPFKEILEVRKDVLAFDTFVECVGHLATLTKK